MNWEILAALGEMAGAIGVIVSLVYLASQIRNQNTESRLAAFTGMTSQWNAILGEMACNRALSRIWGQGIRDVKTLGAIEMVQFSSHCNRVFRLVEGMHRQQSEDKLGKEA